MEFWPILSIITFLPTLGACFAFAVREDDEVLHHSARWIALSVTSLTFILSILVFFSFDSSNPDFQFVEKHDWFGDVFDYHVGVDGISLPFVLLTTFLSLVCVVASWNSVQSRVKEYVIAFMLLETLMIGVFCALDSVLFYLFFEGCLIPMFFIIGIWGGTNRIYASFKFFLYTLLGSVLMLLALMAVYWETGSTNIPFLMKYDFPIPMQFWLWFAFFASFAVKMPMWPMHTWLPDAHVEAPTSGSVILAGILLKMGGYGFLRFSLPMLPVASDAFSDLVFLLSVIAIIYASLIALVQEDMKKLIAYSSVAHMGFVTIGLFTGNVQGIQGAIFQMLSHGIVSGALFLCVGVLYDRTHTRMIEAYGGLAERMPVYATVFLILTMANVALPGTSGFVGEFLVLVGAFQVNGWIAALAASGVILSAAYALWLYRRVVFGAFEPSGVLSEITDVGYRELSILFPFVFLTILLGFYPNLILNFVAASVVDLVSRSGEGVAAMGQHVFVPQ